MPQVRFTHDPKLPRDWANKPYKKGWVGNMSQDEADRWMKRGVVEFISENKAVIHAAAVSPEAAKSSDEKVEALEKNMQEENIRSQAEAKVKAEAEAKAKAEEEAKVKAEVARHTAANPTTTVSGSQSTVAGARR